MWKRAQKDEGSRVTSEDRQWIQLLEALEEFCNRGLNEGVCIQRSGDCMLHKEKEKLSEGRKLSVMRPPPRVAGWRFGC